MELARQLILLVLVTGLLAALALASILVVQRWSSLAARRDSSWKVEAFVWLIGPIHLLTQFLLPFGISFQLVHLGVRGLELVALVVVIFESVRRPKISGLVYFLLLYYFSLILSSVFGATTHIPGSYVISGLGLIAVTGNGVIGREAMVGLGRVCLRSIVAVSLIALIFFPERVFYELQGRSIFGLHQFQGITEHPNAIAFIAAMGLLIEIATTNNWLYEAIFVCTIVMAQSSTAYLIAIVCTLILVLSRCGVPPVGLGLVGMVGSVFVFSDYDAFTAWLPSDAETFSGRTGIWRAAVSEFHNYPVFGYGPTLLDAQFRNRVFDAPFDAAAQAHNQFIQDLGGAGLIGLVCLVLLSIALVIRAVRSSRESGGLTLALAFALLARMMVETPFRPSGLGPSLANLVIIFGVIAAFESKVSADSFPVAEIGQKSGSADPLKELVWWRVR